MSEKRISNRVGQVLSLALILLGIGLIAAYLVIRAPWRDQRVSPGMDTPEATTLNNADTFYPTDILFITRERDEYQDGEMILEVPRLDLRVPVLDGTTDEVLNNGVGLYETAQMPGNKNENVSIAGHRDLAGKEFYYIDTLTDEDLIILEYDGKRFVYVYSGTRVVEANDWSVIYSSDVSCVTLTSCEPIGVANKRIVVTGELLEILYL